MWLLATLPLVGNESGTKKDEFTMLTTTQGPPHGENQQ